MGSPREDLVDVHLHLQDLRLENGRASILGAMREVGVVWWGVNGTCSEDWEEVALLAKSCPEVFPFFGVHPWKVRTVVADWEAQLLKKLAEFPKSGVGEIGVDKWIREPQISSQREIFASQLSIAQREKRPVSIHCLQAWGHLIEVLDESDFDGPFLLHSYGGPLEMISGLCDRGAYFSVSGYFFREDKQNKLETFRKIPGDRILLETDAPDMVPPRELRRYYLRPDSEGSSLNHPANIEVVYEAYARFSERSFEEIASDMKNNLRCWLQDSFRTRHEEPDRL